MLRWCYFSNRTSIAFYSGGVVIIAIHYACCHFMPLTPPQSLHVVWELAFLIRHIEESSGIHTYVDTFILIFTLTCWIHRLPASKWTSLFLYFILCSPDIFFILSIFVLSMQSFPHVHVASAILTMWGVGKYVYVPLKTVHVCYKVFF